MDPLQQHAYTTLQGPKSYSTRSSNRTLEGIMEALNPQTQRVLFFLGKANLSPPSRIPILTGPPVFDSQPPSPTNIERARFLITQQSGHKTPGKHLRQKILPQYRQKKSNHDAESPKKHEVALAFDEFLLETPIEPFATARAILSFAPGTSLYELWHHFHDAKLEDRMASRLKRMTSRLGRSQPSIAPDIPWSWIKRMTALVDIDYVRLMCQAGLNQEVLDWILGAVLAKHSLDTINVSLRYGAVASRCQETVRKRLRQDGIALASLLLSAPSSMSVEAWRYSIEPYKDSPPDVLLLCLANRPDLVCGALLLKALESENLPATAIILAYADTDDEFHDVRQQVCELTTRIEPSQRRYDFFAILLESGCLEDNLVLREELMKDVACRNLPLVKALTSVGISMDIEPNNVISWVISQMDFEIMDIIKNGKFSSPVSPLLELVPQSTSESDMLYLIELLSPLRLTGEPLHSHLVRAVERHRVRLVKKLIQLGASIEFEQASALRTAISRVNLDILDILLQSKISPAALLSTISTAMILKSKYTRLQVMEALLKKGVPALGLGAPLEATVTQEGDVDFELVQLLLRYHAPVDPLVRSAESVISIAARRGNVLLLRRLCDAGARVETLAKAVPVAFEAMTSYGYNIAQSMIELLLSKGACGTPLHETLLSAATKDHKLDIARLLIKSGATANFKSGACYAVAIKTKASELLQILCRDCPLSHESMAAILPTAISPAYYNLSDLELLLCSTSSASAVLNRASITDTLRNNINITTIIPCFLRHGLDVDLEDGFLSKLAIGRKDDSLLRKTLDANPSIKSLKSAFEFAVRGEVKSIDLRTLELLLAKAETADIGQSAALTKFTHHALAGDSQGLRFLLRHGAKVDHTDVQALLAAAKAESFDIIKLLLASRPAPSAVKQVCLAIDCSRLNATHKLDVFNLLLDATGGFSVGNMSELLNDCVVHNQEGIQLAELLLKRGAETNFKTLKTAMARPSPKLILAMVSFIKDRYTLVQLFKEAGSTLDNPDRAISIYQCLLDKNILLGNPISQKVKSEALLNSLSATSRGNTSLVTLLLHSGAMVGYRNGDAFRRALWADSVDAVKILSQYITDDSVAEVAFSHAVAAPLDKHDMRLEVYRCLLEHNIGGKSLHSALLKTLNESSPSHAILKLLLETGANPNNDDAVCFISTAKAGKEAEFLLLSRYAKLRVLLPRLLSGLQEEHQVVKWFRICLKEFPRASITGESQLLLECLRKFPRGIKLLTLLLDKGVSTSALSSCHVRRGWQLEECTVLIWALLREPRIGTDTILTLIAKGREVLPNYSTPETGVSAALCCLLQSQRTDILKALINKYRDRILSYKIHQTWFAHLAMFPKTPKTSADFPGDEMIDLRLASMYLGNVEGFRQLNSALPVDDGLLHLAALLALPKFVQLLLESHDPNYKDETYDFLIPLGVACGAQPRPWCKITKEDSSFRARRRQTMQILARKTNLDWRSPQQQTVLHIAIETGVDITEDMVYALGIQNNPLKASRYSYTDKGGREFSLQEYVTELVRADEDKKEALLSCL